MAPKMGWGEMGEGGTYGRDIHTAGKQYVPNVRWRERGRHHWMDIPTKEEFCVSPYVRGGPDWVVRMTGVGGNCKWRAVMSYSTPSQMWGSWYFPRFLFNAGH